MHRAQFFLAKSCKENIRIAKEKSLWTTTRTIEKLIGEAFLKASVVILVFLARGADHFAGIDFSVTFSFVICNASGDTLFIALASFSVNFPCS